MTARRSLILLSLFAAGIAQADTPIDETRPLAADGVLEVENVAGSIRIHGSDRTDVHVTGRLGEGVEKLDIDGNEHRLKIKVETPSGSGWGGWWGGGRVGDSDLVIEVPAGVELEVDAVSASIDVEAVDGRRIDLESVSGDVGYQGAGKAIDVESVSGAVRLTLGAADEVDVESVSGRITLTGAVAARLHAEAVSGGMQLAPEGRLKSIDASVVSGDIEIDAALDTGGRLSAESLSGALRISLPKSTSARLRASSFSGSIRSDVGEVEKEEYGPGSSLKATLGSGEGEINLESFSGGVRLELK